MLCYANVSHFVKEKRIHMKIPMKPQSRNIVLLRYRLRLSYIPVSILHKSIAGRYRPVRVADGPITARCRFIKNASLDDMTTQNMAELWSAEWPVTFCSGSLNPIMSAKRTRNHGQHYENAPIQIYWNFNYQKLKVFKIKILIFSNFYSTLDFEYLLEPPRRGCPNGYP